MIKLCLNCLQIRIFWHQSHAAIIESEVEIFSARVFFWNYLRYQNIFVCVNSNINIQTNDDFKQIQLLSFKISKYVNFKKFCKMILNTILYTCNEFIFPMRFFKFLVWKLFFRNKRCFSSNFSSLSILF